MHADMNEKHIYKTHHTLTHEHTFARRKIFSQPHICWIYLRRLVCCGSRGWWWWWYVYVYAIFPSEETANRSLFAQFASDFVKDNTEKNSILPCQTHTHLIPVPNQNSLSFWSSNSSACKIPLGLKFLEDFFLFRWIGLQNQIRDLPRLKKTSLSENDLKWKFELSLSWRRKKL